MSLSVNEVFWLRFERGYGEVGEIGQEVKRGCARSAEIPHLNRPDTSPPATMRVLTVLLRCTTSRDARLWMWREE